MTLTGNVFGNIKEIQIQIQQILVVIPEMGDGKILNKYPKIQNSTEN